MEQTNFMREQEENTLKDYINLIRNNLLPVILITLTGLAVAIIYALNAQDIYKSTTSLKLNKPQGNILDAPLLPEFQDFGSDRFIANEIEILKSYTVREKVAYALLDSFRVVNDPEKFYLLLNREFQIRGTNELPLSAHQISTMLETRAKIDQKRGLDIVEISIESPSPYEAALIANCYAEAYKDFNLEMNRTQLTVVKNFLEDQRNEKQSQLSESEDLLKEYQERGGIVALDQQASALVAQLTDFEAQKNLAQIELSVSKNSLDQYKGELKQKDPQLAAYIENFATESYIKILMEEISKQELQKDLAIRSESSSAAKNRAIQDAENKLTDLRGKLNKSLDVYKASIFASSPEDVRQVTQKILEEEVKGLALSTKINELSKIVVMYERRFDRLPRTAIELARLQRIRESIEKLYILVEEKYQEALINEQSKPGNVFIVDPARVPLSPSKPNRILIVLIGFVLGGGLAFGYIFIKNYFDNTIKTPEDIQNKNINVLAWIPQIEGVGENGSKEFEFIVARRPDSIPSEAFKALRTRVQFSKLDSESLKTILVTSSAPQEGKTTVAVNLAGSFAQDNKKTLILDCDLRKPRVHNVFKINRYPGLVDYLFGQVSLDEIIKPTEVNNLSVITAGTIPPNPSEMVGSSAMQQFLSEMKKRFDVIVVDSPPIIAVTDSEILSRLVNGTILVVSANTTEVDLMKKSSELIKHDRGSFLGAVLNNFTYKSGYGSYYKYYYYYSRPGTGDKKDTPKSIKS